MITSKRGFARLLFTTAMLILPSGPAAAAKGDCGQPTSTGISPKTSDALTILRESVGLATDCDSAACICDVNNNKSITTTDALLVLKKAVGQPVSLNCSCGPPAVVDDFNDNSVDPARWGDDQIDGHGVLKETNHELQFTCSPATADDYVLRPWIDSLLPYDADWSVQIDLKNTTVATKDDQVNSFGLSVVDMSNFGNEVYGEMYVSRYNGPPSRSGFYGELGDDGSYLAEVDSGGIGVTSGALRIEFDAAGKVMTLRYDVDPTNGYDWITYGSFGVDGSGGTDGNANWGLSASDRFGVAVYGYSSTMVVTAGQMTGDNFRIAGGVPQ